MMVMKKKKKQGQGVESRKKDGLLVTLCHENVNVPRLHGNERLVDGIDYNEDESVRRFARFLIVVSDKLDPVAQVLPKGEPDRPHATLESQFEKGFPLRPRFVELPPEKTGADGERATRGYIEHRPCDVQLAPEVLNTCEDCEVKWVPQPHLSLQLAFDLVAKDMPHLAMVTRTRSHRREKLRWQGHLRSPRPLERAQLEFGCLRVVA